MMTHAQTDAGTSIGAVAVEDHLDQYGLYELDEFGILNWHGWTDSAVDEYDWYSFTLPADHGRGVPTSSSQTNSCAFLSATFWNRSSIPALPHTHNATDTMSSPMTQWWAGSAELRL